MKRIALILCTLLLMLAALPALAWEVSPAHEELAAALLPGYGVLDGISDGDITALLLTSPEGTTHLAFCTGDEARLTQPLPEELLRIADANLFDETAMLLVADMEGTMYFVGCVPTEEGWTATVSTPLPEGTELLSDSYSPRERAKLRWVATMPGIGGVQRQARTVTVRPDGETWRVTMINLGVLDYVIFEDNLARGEWEAIHGTFTFSRDVTQVNWKLLPTSVEAAAAQMDVANWAIVAEESPLYNVPGGELLARYNPGAYGLILTRMEGWVEISIAGGLTVGWMPIDGLLMGEEQLGTIYADPQSCPVGNPWQNELDVYLYPSSDPDNPLLIHLPPQDAHPVYEMAEWMVDGESWTHVYSPSIPGGAGFVRTEQLNADTEWGHG